MDRLLEAQALRSPDRTALVFGALHLSYQELERRADWLARHLRQLGIGPETRVGLYLERSPEVLIALRALLKAGAAWVPVDPAHPISRIAFELRDSGARAVLTTAALASRLPPGAPPTLLLDGGAPGTTDLPPPTALVEPEAQNLAYVIYTSGSTGRPKAVAVPQGALAHHTAWIQAALPYQADDVVLFKTALSFDAALNEILAPWGVGARLVMAPPGLEWDPAAQIGWIHRHGVTLLETVPAWLRLLLEEPEFGRCTSLRRIHCGGEELAAELVERCLATCSAELVNLYGPTETTIEVTFWAAGPLDVDGQVPIGRPITGVRLHLLSDELLPVDPDQAGELCVAGATLARGYLGRPGATADAFRPDPFGAPGGRLYRTGDLGRWRQDGQLLFLGRRDDQVQVRGFRVEPAEVEAVLRSHQGVVDAAVLARPDPLGERRLVAYYTAGGEAAASDRELRMYLAEHLPGPMVPSELIPLESIPRTPAGKLDRAALPRAWKASGEGSPGPTPRSLSPIESEILTGMAELLGETRIGPEDDFFAFGAHSLLGVRLLARLRRRFGVQLSMEDLFTAPTATALARRLESHPGGPGTGLPVVRPQPRGASAPLSPAQARVAFLQQLDPLSRAYQFQEILRFDGRLEARALAQSLSEICRRHEIYRTRFAPLDGETLQILHPPEPAAVGYVDLTALSAGAREPEARCQIARQVARLFDPERLPLVRWTLYRLGPRRHLLLHHEHHLVHDGWSFNLFLGELLTLYRALVEGRPSPLAEPEVQFADFALLQRRWMEGEQAAGQISYWRGRLAGCPPLENLPYDRPLPPRQTFRGDCFRLDLPGELCDRLRELSRQRSATLFMTFYAVFLVLLHRLTGQRDLAVGTAVANRRWPGSAGLLGMLVDNVVLRQEVAGERSFLRLLAQVRQGTLEAWDHQEVSFDRVVEALRVERNPSRNPLFQVMLSFHDSALPEMRLPDCEVQVDEAIFNRSAKFEINVIGIPRVEQRLGRGAGPDRGVTLTWEYNSDLFDPTTMDRMAGQFRNLLTGVALHPGRPVSRLPLLGAAERWQVLAEWNDTAVGAEPAASTLHGLFELRVGRCPDRVAVVWSELMVSYRELETRAEGLAGCLRSWGVGPEVPVGICLGRTPRMLAALLGVLKAGGAYVPLDPAYPPERLRWMLEDSAAPVVITEEGLLPAPAAAGPRSTGARRLLLEEIGPGRAAGEPPGVARVEVGAEALAYLIYTSGSTGRPKGVAITHGNAVALLCWAQGIFSAQELSGVAAGTSLCFDLSVFELFLPLAAGGTVILVDDALALASLPPVVADRVRLVNTVPSAAAELVRSGALPPHLGICNLAGEPLPRSLADRLYEHPPLEAVYNLYGPSEDTTYSSFVRVPRGQAGEPSIGRPIDGSRAHVLDPSMGPLPVAAAGELYLGGRGVARGYFGRPALTAERFVPDPWSQEAGGRLYRTGDRVRWRSDGELEFFGRMDHQVKVRGFRIELGEIEAALLRHGAVRECAVTVREGEGLDRHLVAFVVTSGLAGPVAAQLEGFLRRSLPEFLIPSAFVSLAALPRTPNGKIDRGALPEPDRSLAPAGEGRPRTPTEEVVADLWAEVLRLDRVGVEEDFFTLGGHSLLAARVRVRLSSLLGLEIPLRTFFDHRTIRTLSRALEALRRSGSRLELPALTPAAEGEAQRLSFAEERLWFVDRLGAGGGTYNLPVALSLGGSPRAAALEAALGEVVRRHAALRSRYPEGPEGPLRRVAPADRRPIQHVDLSGLEPRRRERERWRCLGAAADRPFEVERGPLLRALVLKSGGRHHDLLLNAHHIAIDGGSLEVLFRELPDLYGAAVAGRPSPLAEPALGYGDFAAWQRRWLEGEVLETQMAYWRRQLAGIPATHALPLDRPRPPVQTFRGAQVERQLPPPLSDALFERTRGLGVTRFMTFLALFEALLRRHSGSSDQVVGAPVAGRTLPELEALIGLLTNTLVLRTEVSAELTFEELLGRVRETALEAYAHQEVPFEKLVAELEPDRDLSRNPLFQVAFVFEDEPAEPPALAGVTVDWLDLPQTTIKFDLVLTLRRSGRDLRAAFAYNADLFDRTTLQRFAGHYEELLAAAVQEPEGAVGRWPLLSPAERWQLLGEWGEDPLGSSAVRDFQRGFDHWAARSPHRLAVVSEGQAWSYGELARRSRRLAQRLRRRGAGPEAVVALALERSADFLIGVLGVLRCGAAYLPVDPDLPAERSGWMLTETGVALVVTRRDLEPRLARTGWERIDPHGPYETSEGAPEGGSEPPAPEIDPGHLAYVIYTSGSTGKPKGTMLTRGGLAHFVGTQIETLALGVEDRVLQVASISFDASVFEMAAAWEAGATLVLARPAERFGGEALEALLRREQITVALLSPSVLATLSDTGELPALQRLITGGEAGSPDLADRWAPGRRFFNAYGPTEGTVWATLARCRSGRGGLPIGRPVPRVQIRLLDGELQPVPIGVAGELTIGGPGLSRGYMGRSALTAERFIPDPLGELPGARLYRSGDLACLLPDGQIRFLGRLDHQVKVRGFRVELGEIEAALSSHPRVRDAVVTAVAERGAAVAGGSKTLVAYVVADGGEPPEASELRGFLRRTLPEAMVPSVFFTLEALPLTSSGKVDRRALPAPERARLTSRAAAAPPANDEERALVRLWRSVLKLEEVGVDENFFDLGGHSLALVRAQRELASEMGEEVTLVELFTYPTVRNLAEFLRRRRGPAPPAVAARGEPREAAAVAEGKARMARQLGLSRRIARERAAERDPAR